MSGVFNAPIYGIDTWGNLFAPRQVLTLTTLTRLVREMEDKLVNEQEGSFATAIQTCLALVIDRQVDKSSSLTRWDNSRENPQGTFARQALPMIWDFCEVNPFSGSGGDWDTALAWVVQVINQCVLGFSTKGTAFHQGTAAYATATSHPLPTDAAQVLATDPPYYNAVPYADLSDFFYVWLKRIIGDKYTDLFSDPLVPKEDEICEMAGWDADRYPHKNGKWFEQKMGQAMAEGCRILSPDGIGIVVFAHKSTSGWEAQLQAMNDAGWIITGSWPIDTEMGSRLRAMDSAALASSIHLVCRPRKNPDGSMRIDDVGDWRDVLQELPRRMKEWLPRLAAEGIVGADAIFSCLGPALEIFSRYSYVERADGERVTLKEYLEHVWVAVSRETLNTIFQGTDTSSFEPDARLTAMWLWTLSTGGEKNGNGNEQKQRQANGKHATVKEAGADYEVGEGEEDTGPKLGTNGYVLEFDAARKIAQGLGAHLDKVSTLVEIKGSTARLRSLQERARFLFQKGADDLSLSKPRKKAKIQQQSLFLLQDLSEEADMIGSMGDMPEFNLGSTILDRVHQAMLLYAAGRTDALRRFLKEEGAGTDQRFWKLAVALSSLYPRRSDERRWVDGVQNQKKSLGL
jgi:adenine-specific DNA methylase